MPRANVWIKEKDLEAWNALENKSEWISNKLTDSVSTIYGEPTNTPKGRALAKDYLKRKSYVDYCEHGQPKGECLWKGCKYGR